MRLIKSTRKDKFGYYAWEFHMTREKRFWFWSLWLMWCMNVQCLDGINKIHKERWGWLPRMMIMYDKRAKILIVKLMVRVLHECVTRLDEIKRIHKEKWGYLPRMTILYDKREKILILKLMVSVVHECVICLDGINKIYEEIWSWLPHMMIMYDRRAKILIMKLIVGVLHECEHVSMKSIGNMRKDEVGYHTWQFYMTREKRFWSFAHG
jgi:hypothetical protein